MARPSPSQGGAAESAGRPRRAQGRPHARNSLADGKLLVSRGDPSFGSHAGAGSPSCWAVMPAWSWRSEAKGGGPRVEQQVEGGRRRLARRRARSRSCIRWRAPQPIACGSPGRDLAHSRAGACRRPGAGGRRRRQRARDPARSRGRWMARSDGRFFFEGCGAMRGQGMIHESCCRDWGCAVLGGDCAAGLA